MEPPFSQALIAGVERVSAWADLLDDINVFPVADGDTGRNLVISLSPLRQITQGRDRIIRELLLSARGNSGNIAARFFSGLLMADAVHQPAGGHPRGSEPAWQAVNDPNRARCSPSSTPWSRPWRRRPGRTTPPGGNGCSTASRAVETPDCCRSSRRRASSTPGPWASSSIWTGSSARSRGTSTPFKPITDIFRTPSRFPRNSRRPETGYCVDTVLRGAADDADTVRRLTALGESVVVLKDGDYLKVHLHARDGQKARGELGAFGDVVRWSVDDLDAQVHSFRRRRVEAAVHILTDAAGSVNRQNTAQLGITLLDSYLTVGDKCLPETHFAPEELYDAMRRV